ncbi:hypothetical protein SASPL_112975 [Salvia splendens]|uniref:Uncharacterized protein n=1 Tax=Salvia splendens TaxID=180675 RepID=A0A8X8YBS6_SALSN|nr:hypothetical protein SASPL_112975 [Salvia splendens]
MLLFNMSFLSSSTFIFVCIFFITSLPKSASPDAHTMSESEELESWYCCFLPAVTTTSSGLLVPPRVEGLRSSAFARARERNGEEERVRVSTTTEIDVAGATTIDRRLSAKLVLGSNQEFDGESSSNKPFLKWTSPTRSVIL